MAEGSFRHGPTVLRSVALDLLALGLLSCLILVMSVPQRATQLPSVQLIWYPVDGRNLIEVRRSVEERGPIDQYGIRREAYTEWSLAWSWPEPTSSVLLPSPAIQVPTIQASLKLYLPLWQQWREAVPEQRDRWGRYLKSSIDHELLHIESARRNFARLQSQFAKWHSEDLPAHKKELDRAIADQIARWRVDDQVIDAGSQHGCLTGACLVNL